jgi:succinyl-CoA synthetase alpha subunit
MPGFVFKKGKVGIVSKSGTLTYEADQVVRAGYGVSTAIGIGGDPIIGTTTKEALELFINDPETEAVVMIGEIGGSLEAEAARWYKASGSTKPVVGFIAGQTAPKGRTGARWCYCRWCRRYRTSQNGHYERKRNKCSRFSCGYWQNCCQSIRIIFYL